MHVACQSFTHSINGLVPVFPDGIGGAGGEEGGEFLGAALVGDIGLAFGFVLGVGATLRSLTLEFQSFRLQPYWAVV